MQNKNHDNNLNEERMKLERVEICLKMQKDIQTVQNQEYTGRMTAIMKETGEKVSKKLVRDGSTDQDQQPS